jgi:hypothetical protein
MTTLDAVYILTTGYVACLFYVLSGSLGASLAFLGGSIALWVIEKIFHTTN